MQTAEKLEIEDWGRIDYGAALERQTVLFEEAVKEKQEGERPKNRIVVCEHNHVYTIGKSGKDANLLVSAAFLERLGVPLFHIRRGGDITYHGPGQIVVYPIIDLEQFGLGLRDYIFALEEAVIRTCADYGVVAARLEKATGVWIEPHTRQERKICAIGVQSSKYVTMHGLAFNVNTDLSFFRNINPCGFTDKGVTSLRCECGVEMDLGVVKSKLLANLSGLLEHGK